jgi:hypothetical protein
MRKSQSEWKEIAEEEKLKRLEIEELCRKMHEREKRGLNKERLRE